MVKDRCCSRSTGMTITLYFDYNTVVIVITSVDNKSCDMCYFDIVAECHKHCQFVLY